MFTKKPLDKKPLKLIFLSYVCWPPDFGGELLITLERFETLAECGHQIQVLTSGRPGYPRRSRAGGYAIRRSPTVGERRWQRALRRLVFWLWAAWLLFRLDYDVLHFGASAGFNRPSSALMFWGHALIARLKKARRIWVHSLAEREDAALDLRGLNRLWYRTFFANLSQVVAVSPALYTSLHDFIPQKSLLLTCGVRDDLFKPLAPDARGRTRSNECLPPDAVVFVFLGTVGCRKGFDLLARVFAELAPDRPDWRLWVIGPYRASENQNIDLKDVERVIEPLRPVMAQVKFWGRVDQRNELARLMGISDVFVFPTRREGMPISPIEAMSSGLPVIISRLPGVTDLANQEGKTGLYVQPGSIDDLRRAMLQLGEDPGLRESMGRAARIRVVESFGWEAHVRAWERLYQSGSPAA